MGYINYNFIEVSPDLKSVRHIDTKSIDGYNPVIGEIVDIDRYFCDCFFRIIGIRTKFKYISSDTQRYIYLQRIDGLNRLCYNEHSKHEFTEDEYVKYFIEPNINNFELCQEQNR